MKAVISNRIYFTADEDTLHKVRSALTYKLEIAGATRGGKAVKTIEIIRNYKMLPKNIISIPQGRQDLIQQGYETLDKRVTIAAEFPQATKSLRAEQQIVLDSINDTCFLNALVGWGKGLPHVRAI